MTILHIRHQPLRDTHRLGDQRLNTPPHTIQLHEPSTEIARTQPIQISDLRHLDRTHLPIMTTGCYTVLLASPCACYVDLIHLATAINAGAARFVTNNSRAFPKSIAEINVTYPMDLTDP
jgi:hypothetical protein